MNFKHITLAPQPYITMTRVCILCDVAYDLDKMTSINYIRTYASVTTYVV